MRKKPCAEIECEFDVWIWKVNSLFIPSDIWAFDRVKTAVKSKTWKSSWFYILLFLIHLVIMWKVSANVFTNFQSNVRYRFPSDRFLRFWINAFTWSLGVKKVGILHRYITCGKFMQYWNYLFYLSINNK